MFLDDLDARLAAIAVRGLEPEEIETYSGGVRKAIYRDPDGNEVGFGGATPDAGSLIASRRKPTDARRAQCPRGRRPVCG